MKPINLKLVEVETDACTGCFYLDEALNCTNQNHPYGELACLSNYGHTAYIFEEDRE